MVNLVASISKHVKARLGLSRCDAIDWITGQRCNRLVLPWQDLVIPFGRGSTPQHHACHHNDKQTLFSDNLENMPAELQNDDEWRSYLHCGHRQPFAQAA